MLFVFYLLFIQIRNNYKRARGKVEEWVYGTLQSKKVETESFEFILFIKWLFSVQPTKEK